MDRGTVLVVDDDPMIVDLLREILEGNDYRVEATVGAATPGIAHDLRPDVILLDLHMPDMDGAEVSQLLHADPVTAGIPVIALSAVHNLQARAAAMVVDDYLAKPFEMGDLLMHVDKWTGQRAGT